MRALLLIAVSLVLASAVTVRLTEVERTAVGSGVLATFTTRNPIYANSIFLITRTQIIRRYSSGSKTVILDFAASGLGGVIRTAAIHPTEQTIVLGWTRDANAAQKEGHQWWARNETHARATPATQVVTVAKFAISAKDDNSVDVSSRVDIIQFGAWDAQEAWDLGNVRFQTVKDKTYLWVPTANSFPMTLGIWDFFQQGKEAGSFQGRLLRFDLSQPAPFTPLDNPFLNTTVRNSVYAYGFAWPRSVLFTETNDVWVTDYQSSVADEINQVMPSRDYGWNILEGTNCVQPPKGCSSKNTIVPRYSWNIPTGKDFTYGLSSGFYYGEGQFILSWNGTASAGQFVNFDSTTNTAEDVNLVDQRDIGTNWYYSGLQLQINEEPISQKQFYVLGRWFNNDSAILFTAEVVQSGAAQMSILAALVIAVIAALLH